MLGPAQAAIGTDDQMEVQPGWNMTVWPGDGSKQEVVRRQTGYLRQSDRLRTRIVPQHGSDRPGADQMRDEAAVKTGW